MALLIPFIGYLSGFEIATKFFPLQLKYLEKLQVANLQLVVTFALSKQKG